MQYQIHKTTRIEKDHDRKNKNINAPHYTKQFYFNDAYSLCNL